MTTEPPKYMKLLPGEHAPRFKARETQNPNYVFDTAAGRYLVLCFFASASNPAGRPVFTEVLEKHRALFDDETFAFFGVTIDPADEAPGVLAPRLPGIRFFYDADQAVSRLYGVAPINAQPGDRIAVRCQWIVLDPTMRILNIISFRDNGADCAELVAYLKSLPPVPRFAGIELQAPILYLPNVFEPKLCAELIGLYEKDGGKDSGFMRDVDGMTVAINDHARKSRRDYVVDEEPVLKQVNNRILRRIVPEIRKVHQFDVTRIERYIVACYSAEEKGHFAAHRDDTTKGTAHRRFAVTINLNSEFEGGELCFPEYGPRSFKPPPGGAVVFSCSLLHAVSQVTKGRRFAFLPFLYDEAAKKIRDENRKFLANAAESAY